MERGRPFVVVWQETAAQLEGLYRAERDATLARRWHALWLLRNEQELADVAATIGVAYRTIQEWVAWYRRGGLDEVRAHRRGGNRRVSAPLVSAEQVAAVLREARTHGFATQALVRDWLAQHHGVTLTPKQGRRLVAQLGLRLKVPRPLAAKADLDQQAGWKKGGSPMP